MASSPAEELPAWLTEGLAEDPSCTCTMSTAWLALRDAWGLRLEGNQAFAKSDLREALRAYQEAEVLVCRAEGVARLEGPADPYQAQLLHTGCARVRVPVGSNLALVHLKLGNYLGAVHSATACLAADASHVKALFRRALGHLGLQNVAAAELDLQQAALLEPANKEVREALRNLRRETAVTEATAVVEVAEEQEEPQTEGEKELLTKLWTELLGGGLSASTSTEILGWSRAHGAGALLASRPPQTLDKDEDILTFLCSGSRSSSGTLAGQLVAQLKAQEASVLLARRWGPLGRSALHLAAASPGSLELFEALLEAGAEVNAKDADEQTALHVASARGDAEQVSRLLDAGCEPDPLDRWQRTPLYYAGVRGHREVAGLLVNRGKADQSVLFHALKETFGTHNFHQHEWPEYNGRWMTSKEGRAEDVPLRPARGLPKAPREVQTAPPS